MEYKPFIILSFLISPLNIILPAVLLQSKYVFDPITNVVKQEGRRG